MSIEETRNKVRQSDTVQRSREVHWFTTKEWQARVKPGKRNKLPNDSKTETGRNINPKQSISTISTISKADNPQTLGNTDKGLECLT